MSLARHTPMPMDGHALTTPTTRSPVSQVLALSIISPKKRMRTDDSFVVLERRPEISSFPFSVLEQDQRELVEKYVAETCFSLFSQLFQSPEPKGAEQVL